jgi:hypothetical protein
VRSFLAKCYSDDQIEKNEMDGICSTYGKRRCVTGFWWGNPRERDHLNDPCLNGMIILKWMFKQWNGDTDWIYLDQNRDRWLALLNWVVSLRAS